MYGQYDHMSRSGDDVVALAESIQARLNAVQQVNEYGNGGTNTAQEERRRIGKMMPFHVIFTSQCCLLMLQLQEKSQTVQLIYISI